LGRISFRILAFVVKLPVSFFPTDPQLFVFWIFDFFDRDRDDDDDDDGRPSLILLPLDCNAPAKTPRAAICDISDRAACPPAVGPNISSLPWRPLSTNRHIRNPFDI
jgi:hypothetical protein